MCSRPAGGLHTRTTRYTVPHCPAHSIHLKIVALPLRSVDVKHAEEIAAKGEEGHRLEVEEPRLNLTELHSFSSSSIHVSREP